MLAAETIPDLVYMISYPLLNNKGSQDEPKFEAHPLLDLKADVDGLQNSLREANKMARVAVKIATSQNMTDVLSQGCKVLHYSGHVRQFTAQSVQLTVLRVTVIMYICVRDCCFQHVSWLCFKHHAGRGRTFGV
jgi:uncharacterized protein (DUF2342 family)